MFPASLSTSHSIPNDSDQDPVGASCKLEAAKIKAQMEKVVNESLTVQLTLSLIMVVSIIWRSR